MLKQKFIPGATYIPASGKIYDQNEINNAIKVAREGWWTEGIWVKKFEEQFRKIFGIKYFSLVNSGSSANLLALACLTSKTLGDKRLKKSDEFITTACSFPTTVNPGLIYGLTPVFIDIKLNDLNIDEDKIEKAISKKTKLIMVAHTLGIPFNIEKIMKIAKKYSLWVIEDCCDALGSAYKNKYVGTFGHLSTFSYYPAHQITMGEGGGVGTNDPLLSLLIKRFRDWGRDCWCDTGHDNTCGQRFSQKFGKLPLGFDHKYVYSEIGYNLKTTDFQAAIGVAQLKKLPFIIKKRKENYFMLLNLLKKWSDYFIFPNVDSSIDPCWFGLMIIVKRSAPFKRNDLVRYLEEHKIGTRNLFAGNLLRHPAYSDIKFRQFENLNNCDNITENGFWIGVFPGITQEMIKYTISQFSKFLSSYPTSK